MSYRCCLIGVFGLTLLVLACKREEQTSPESGPPFSDVPPLGGGPGGKPPAGFPPIKPPAMLEETEPHAAGKKVYNANGCARCHTMGADVAGPAFPPMPPLPKDAPAINDGPPMGKPPMMNKGPDLAKTAGKPGRNVEWFIAFVSNPRNEKPYTRMPAFEKKIKPEDMRALAEFLADLK
jgi:mono/diheme cytochrome c family protein